MEGKKELKFRKLRKEALNTKSIFPLPNFKRITSFHNILKSWELKLNQFFIYTTINYLNDELMVFQINYLILGLVKAN